MTDRPGSEPPARAKPPEADENRTLTNMVLAVVFLLLVGSGIWLVGEMLDARRADQCMGRRNCSAVPITPQQLR